MSDIFVSVESLRRVMDINIYFEMIKSVWFEIKKGVLNMILF